MRVAPLVNVIRYSDFDRSMLAKQAAIFLGKEDEGNTKRPLNLLRQEHMSIFRGESVDFEFVTSKVVYDHLTTYDTKQRRACAGLRANQAGDFVLPLEIVGTELEPVIDAIGTRHRGEYLDLIKGIDPDTEDSIEKVRLQAARSVAPMSVNLHFSLQFNFQTLMTSLFPQRIWESGAQPDTKEVVLLMWEAVRLYDPELWETAFDVFGPEAIAWKKLRHTLKRRHITLAHMGVRDPMIDEEPVVAQLLRSYGKQKSMWD